LVKKQEVSKKETTFHLPKDLVIALKTRAVQESRPYSARGPRGNRKISKRNCEACLIHDIFSEIL
jgi:hypothetical protein